MTEPYSQEALTVARDAIAHIRDRGATSIDLARAALEAAAPHLRAAERERIRQLATQLGAIYPLRVPLPAVTVNGEPIGDTRGNVVLWPDGMPATAPFASLLTEGTTT